MRSTLAQIFITDRHRQRAAGNVGHSVPAFSEVEIVGQIEPLLVTNMKGTFLRSRVSEYGHARFGFYECDLLHEDELLHAFYKVLVTCSKQEGWCNVVSSASEALDRMRLLGVPPTVALTANEAPEVPGVLNLQVGLPEGAVLLVGPPERAGLHTRVGGHVGILAQRVNTSFVAVAL